jgi:trans-aconitate 2-methyltransferase
MSDWDPELYNRFNGYRTEPVTMMLSRLELGPRERIVDWGCGTGEHTIELARRSAEGSVLGIDSSPAMIQGALKLREQLAPDLRRRLQFKLADFRSFEADHEYTLVFSNAALQWTSDHRSVLATAYRALCRNGRLVVQIPANENEAAQTTVHQMAAEPPWNATLSEVRTPSAENVLPAADYRRLLAEIGFAQVDCFYHTFHHPMRNAVEVVEFCRSTSLRQFLDRLPAAQHHVFLAELTRRLETAYGTRSSLEFNFRRLFLWGVKLDESRTS